MAALTSGYLVHLIEKHDAVILHSPDRFSRYRLRINQFLGFLLDEQRTGFGHPCPFSSLLAGEEIAQ